MKESIRPKHSDRKEVGCSTSGVSVVCFSWVTIKIEAIAVGRGTSKFIYFVSTISLED